MLKDIEEKYRPDENETLEMVSDTNHHGSTGNLFEPHFRSTDESFSDPQNLESTEDASQFWKTVNEQLEERRALSDSESEYQKDTTLQLLKNQLAEWAISGNIPLMSVTKLLGILRNYGIDLPAQATTLLKTPKNITVSKKSGIFSNFTKHKV